jgi:hypothetical protein
MEIWEEPSAACLSAGAALILPGRRADFSDGALVS